MQTTLFIFYLVFFGFIITIIPFFKNSGVGKPLLVSLFFIKILAGIAYAKFYTLPRYYANSDTWRFYRLSLDETKWLLRSPVSFIRDLFQHGYVETGNIFSGYNSYWNDLKSNVPVKIMAVFNIVTNNSYYSNIILFNFLFLFGLVAIFKVFTDLFPGRKKVSILGIFLLPSTLFWCSGIHKDGLILSAIGLFFYSCFRMVTRGFSLKYLFVILVAGVLIFSLRNYVLLAMMPAILCWLLSRKFPDKIALIFYSTYTVGIISFFIIPKVFPSINLPYYIVQKQQEFLQLPGRSEVKADPLHPDIISFIRFLPHAIDMAFFRPHFTEFKNLSYLPAVVENLVLIVLIIFSVFHLRRQAKISPVVICFFTFSVSVLIVCGYTIPFTGAIVRYRSIALPFLITPLLCIADFATRKKKIG